MPVSRATTCRKRLNLKRISVKYFMTKSLAAGLAAVGRFSASGCELPAASFQFQRQPWFWISGECSAFWPSGRSCSVLNSDLIVAS
jgi:hypothetical protein